MNGVAGNFVGWGMMGVRLCGRFGVDGGGVNVE